MALGCPVCNLLSGYPGGKLYCEREDCPELDTDSRVHAEIVSIGDKILEAQVRQKARIEALEAALRPFAAMAIAVENHMPAQDDRWALIRVRDTAITHADLKRAKQTMSEPG